MNFEDYRLEERNRYVEFVEAVRHILNAPVKAAGMKPHATTGRAKDVISLEISGSLARTQVRPPFLL